LKETPVHQILNPINIEIAISNVLPEPFCQFLIGKLKLCNHQIAGTTEVLLLVCSHRGVVSKQIRLKGVQKCHTSNIATPSLRQNVRGVSSLKTKSMISLRRHSISPTTGRQHLDRLPGLEFQLNRTRQSLYRSIGTDQPILAASTARSSIESKGRHSP
jgi:hypothetical protein